ncbi:hypothetical protein ACWD4J_42715 [Streptomyces sp. NPDC002577]
MDKERDLDGRLILPWERIEAIDKVLELRKAAVGAGNVPYPHDWPLPMCPICRGTVGSYVRSGGSDEIRYHFFPCGHGVVAYSVAAAVSPGG